MNAPVIVRVSFSDQMNGSRTRREVALPKDIPDTIVRLRNNGNPPTPAMIGFRSVLSLVQTRDGLLHQWHFTVSPDDEAMRRRFLAETGTMIDEGGAVHRDASYSIVTALRDAHRQISELKDPDPFDGTTIQMWLGFETNGVDYTPMTASSLTGLERASRRAQEENDRRDRNRRRIYFPLTRWLLWQESVDYVDEPVVPTHDEWKTHHKAALGTLLTRSFGPCLKSLWRATYGGSVNEAQLRACGFPIDDVGRTMLPAQNLRDVIARQDKSENRTMFFVPGEHELPKLAPPPDEE